MKILVIRTSAIGDVFLSGGFAQYIKTVYPDCELHWLAEKRCSAVLENISYIDKIIIWERNRKAGIKGLFDSAKDLDLDKDYDLTIDLQCLLKLFPILKKIKSKKKAGISEYEFPMNIFYDKIYPTKRFEPLKEKYHRLAKEILGYDGPALDPIVSYTEADRKKAEVFFEENNLKKAVACVFATSKIHKYWETEKWTELGREIGKKYNAKCILFGAGSDREYAQAIMKNSDDFVSAVGKFSIMESMACLSLCSACVSTDTALMHFSTIMNKPTVSLYGTNFFYAHHYGRENAAIIYKGDKNNKDRKVPDDVCMKNMKAIEVADVMNALAGFLP
ncbi:MAG: glycosyltransferase family 9 protein [Armatimonadetes bacterium]|nr:glycosyltransferase family 9 protein [Candidatus Hippobium faecium]